MLKYASLRNMNSIVWQLLKELPLTNRVERVALQKENPWHIFKTPCN